MKLALWAAGVLAAVAIAVAANVVLLRTGDTGSDPIGTLSPTLFRPPAQRPATTTEPTTTGDDHHTGTDSHTPGGDDSEDD